MFGFTLVELIVVITILVILGTIAFMNLGGYSSSARDSTRIENLANLQKGLSVYQAKAGTYPLPEGPLSILASGSIIGYQGFAKDQVAGLANLSAGGTKDPSDASMYTTYAVSYNQTKMQVMSFLENGSTVTSFVPLVPVASASSTSDYSTRTPVTKGDTLGILLDSGTGATKNQPVQEKYDVNAFTGVDVVNTNTGYTAVFSKTDTLSGSGNALVALKASFKPVSSSSALTRDPSLIGYWDMETTTPNGWVADLSGNGNNGTGAGLLTIGGEQGIRSMATRTSSGATTAMTTPLLMQTGSSFTVSATYKINAYGSIGSPLVTPANSILGFGYLGSAQALTNLFDVKIYGNNNIQFRW